ncbi:hypothetical protein DM01DRAFT_330628 [Hesseltinella vesiculosa]|uniref:Nuclear pore complex NUP2/50/61 domain-containing protein n=1 Tax=Hesseltinella vesiculosa TaxID=101127 RepID=A0A1X2GBD3_9FUNG|nr:hypothetical protein DM01DRAFT_330628 [Hesseltinella vesiculosa]
MLRRMTRTNVVYPVFTAYGSPDPATSPVPLAKVDIEPSRPAAPSDVEPSDPPTPAEVLPTGPPATSMVMPFVSADPRVRLCRRHRQRRARHAAFVRAFGCRPSRSQCAFALAVFFWPAPVPMDVCAPEPVPAMSAHPSEAPAIPATSSRPSAVPKGGFSFYEDDEVDYGYSDEEGEEEGEEDVEDSNEDSNEGDEDDDFPRMASAEVLATRHIKSPRRRINHGCVPSAPGRAAFSQ